MKQWYFGSMIVVSLIAAAGTTLGADTAITSKVRRAAKTVRQIVAHRGSSADRPECTMAAFHRAIESGATAFEIDVRTTKDGRLIILHDTTVDRTTNGKGKVNDLTLEEIKQLDAGSWFDAKYKNERIPTLREVLVGTKGEIDVLLDLKESGDRYARQVVAEVRKFGEPKRIIVGVRSVEQAKRFRKLLPTARQLGLIPNPDAIESFAKAGVETIRLWPKWLKDETLVSRVRKTGAALHLNGTTGKSEEVIPLLKHQPASLSSDAPARLVKTLRVLQVKK